MAPDRVIRCFWAVGCYILLRFPTTIWPVGNIYPQECFNTAKSQTRWFSQVIFEPIKKETA